MPGCAVACCTMYNRMSKGKNIVYHYFPENPELQKVWVLKCKRKDDFKVKNARICSKHFTADCYIRDLKSELLGLPPKRKLKADAVPTVNLPGTIVCTDVTTSNPEQSSAIPISENVSPAESRLHGREVRKRALEHFCNLSPKKQKIDKSVSTDITPSSTADVQLMIKQIKSLEDKNKKLNTECTKLRVQNKSLRNQLVCTRRQLHECLNNCNSQVTTKVSQVLGKLFTANQLRCLISGKKKVHWDKDDICKAITLRAISMKSYNFLRMKMGFPLPGLSTLRRWTTRSFRCHPGILHDVLQLMKIQAERYTNLQRVCVISFDEMNVDRRISYDQEEDRIFGPYSNVQVVMVRGLFSSWKQPIYYDFDVQMTALLLKDIISSLENIKYNVVAVVSDLGPKNRTVWNELSVSHTNTCFANPSDPQKRVWVFADVPHLYKLMRNHFIDVGFTLPGKKKVTKATIEHLLSLDCSEIRICPKLSQHHLTVKGRERQRVRLAIELFSNHTAQGIRQLIPNEEPLAKFIQLINDSFDVLNSRKPSDDRPNACGFGMQLDIQKRTLRQLYACCTGMRVGAAKHFLPFQKGFLTTIRSLLGLFSDLKPLNAKYILTSRLNQDCLENFFSRIRGIGHFYDNPLPSEVKCRIRLLLLGANVSDIPLSSASPVTSDGDDDSSFLTFQLLGRILPDMSESLSIVEGISEMRDVVFDNSDEVDPSTLSPIRNDCSVEGFKYIAGYLAYRGRKYDHSLGTPTGQLPAVPCDVASACWIRTLSRGGLLVPSDDWLSKISQFELMFTLFHGKHSLSPERNIVQKLCETISEKFPDTPVQLVKLYVRTRTFIRLRFLNLKAKAEKAAEAQRRKARKWLASSK